MNDKKIVMIGPVYPFKGGIAHYTGLMCNALAKKCDVTMVSYKMQYPKVLFKKEQRDYANDIFKVENTNYWLNTANPFNIIQTARKINALKPEIVIIQWWHPYFAPCYWLLSKCIKECKVMFVCHNVFPHEKFPFDKKLSRLALKRGNRFIVHSKLDEGNLKTIKADAQYIRTVHPTYNAFKLEGMSKEDARKYLGLNCDEKVLLFFGFVREYKGLKHLIRAMPQIVSNLDHVRLMVVGDFDGDKEQYINLIQSESVIEAVQIVDGYIPDKAVEPYFAACDLVILPYESATQSGIVQIAFGFEKPVIATNVGGLPEVVEDEWTGNIVEPCNFNQLANAVIQFYKEDKGERFSNNVAWEAKKYSWERMVATVLQLSE